MQTSWYRKPTSYLVDVEDIHFKERKAGTARNRYCPAALWLGPFTAAEAAADESAEERFSAAAVMRALLQGPPGSPAQNK